MQSWPKDKASAMLMAASTDNARRVCSTQVGDPLQVPELLHNRFVSNQTATRAFVLTSMYTKRFNSTEDEMPDYVDDFEFSFAQLERMV